MKKILFYSLSAFFALAPLKTFAEEITPFYGFFSARHYNFQYIDDLHTKNYKAILSGKKKGSVRLDEDWFFDWMLDRKEFQNFMLCDFICNNAYEVPESKKISVFKDFLEWKKYLKNEGNFFSGIFRTTNAMHIDSVILAVQRLETRYQAIDLQLNQPEKYSIYSELLNKAKVRVNRGGITVPVKFTYGEIYTIESGFSKFHAELIPETCLKKDEKFFGCLRTFENLYRGIHANYFFCIWNEKGEPIAMYPLNIPQEKRNAFPMELDQKQNILKINKKDGVFSEKIELKLNGNYAEISFLHTSPYPAKKHWSAKFSCTETNNHALPTGY